MITYEAKWTQVKWVVQNSGLWWRVQILIFSTMKSLLKTVTDWLEEWLSAFQETKISGYERTVHFDERSKEQHTVYQIRKPLHIKIPLVYNVLSCPTNVSMKSQTNGVPFWTKVYKLLSHSNLSLTVVRSITYIWTDIEIDAVLVAFYELLLIRADHDKSKTS